MLLSYDVQDPGDTLGVTRCPSQCWYSNAQNADTWRPKFIRVPYAMFDTTLSTQTVAGFTATHTGNNTWQFTNTSTFATQYLWDFGDGDTSSLRHPTHTYVSSGAYTVNLTAFGCNSSRSTDSTITSLLDPVNPYPSLTVFPNPNDGHFTVSARDLGKQAVTIEVLTIVGQRIVSQAYKPIGGSLRADIDVDGMQGMYLLRFSNGGGSVIRKLVVR